MRCICVCIIMLICGMFAIDKYSDVYKKEVDSNYEKMVDTSILIRYKGNSYIVVPEDILEENEKYISLIKKYNLPIKIDVKCIDKMVEKLEGNNYLYTIKSAKDVILLLKDYNNDYCYAIKK